MDEPRFPDMGETSGERWEAVVTAAARAFTYPPLPDIAGRVQARLARSQRGPRRRVALAGILAAALLAVLLLVPQARAAVVEVLRLGAIRIHLLEATPTPAPPRLPAVQPGRPPATVTPAATRAPAASPLDLAGETTLAAARTAVSFPIGLPAYPADLGAPARVFVQDLGGPVVILVWLDPGQPGQPRLSLHEFGPGTFAEKSPPLTVQETTVNGRRALWTTGPHLLELASGETVITELVKGNALIWLVGDVTYRLETDLPLAEAVRIAESVR